MEHAICLNSLSMPAKDREEAYNLLLDACFGILELNRGNDRFSLYYDDSRNRRIYEAPLSKNYTYENFLDELPQKNEHDIHAFLLETEDKSPAIEYLSYEQLDELGFYIPNTGSNEYMDTLGVAWLNNATLISLLTDNIWDSYKIEIARLSDDGCGENRYFLDNIAKYEHGRELRAKIERLSERTLDEICPECIFTENFNKWYDKLEETNRHRVRDKLNIACKRNFQGGKPLFETLENGDGLREMRFSAYPGGTMRLIFGKLYDRQQAVLTGFIKKSDTEGYKENIPKAKKLWKKLREAKDNDI